MNKALTMPSHMCVYFSKENSFQVLADHKGSFKAKSFAKHLDQTTNKWRLGEIKYRGM